MYFLAQKRLSFSDRILRHSESGKYGGCLDCSLFNPKFSPLDASFFALNGSRARISWKKMAYRSVQSMLDHIHFFLLQDLDNTSTLIGLNGVRKRNEENLQRAIIFTAHFSTDQCIRKKHVFREFIPRKYTVHTEIVKESCLNENNLLTSWTKRQTLFFDVSDNTELWWEFSFEGYRKKVKTHYERPRAVSDIPRIRRLLVNTRLY